MPEHRRRHRSRSPGSAAGGSRLSDRAHRPHSPPRMRSDDLKRPTVSQTARRRAASPSPAALHRRPAASVELGYRSALERGDLASPRVQIRRNVSPGLLKRRTHYQAMFRKDLESMERGKFRALGSQTRAEHGLIFGGSEFGQVEVKEQRKIQIDIRRNIPSHRISTSPVRRELLRPETLRIPRRKGEGEKPLFDRPEFLECLETGAIQEERSVNLVAPTESKKWPRGHDLDDDDDVTTRSGLRDRSRSPLRNPDLRRRLGEPNPRESIRDRLGGNGSSSSQTHMDRSDRSSVRDRLGGSNARHRSRGRGMDGDDEQAILDREELERHRPMVKPWDVNPEFVPRGRNYFEHDDRERGGGGHQNEIRGFGDGDRRRSSRGGFGGRGRRGGGDGRADWSRGGGDRNFSRRRNRGGSPEWKHDKFAEINQDEDDKRVEMDQG